MQKNIKTLILFGAALLWVCSGGIALAMAAESTASLSQYFGELIYVITGDWQKWGELFTLLQGNQYFMYGFLLLITVIPAIFAMHLLIVGAKHFDHSGNQILFFPLFARIVHFIGAASFSALTITGILIVCGRNFYSSGSIYTHFCGDGRFTGSYLYVNYLV